LCVAYQLSRYKRFLEESNIGLKHNSLSNYLFLSNSISRIVLNCHKTPQRTYHTSLLLKSQEICMSFMCWTLSQVFPQVECKS
jgi:hypothetical protein